MSPIRSSVVSKLRHLSLVLGSACALACGLITSSGCGGGADAAAVKKLEELGAIIVSDSSGAPSSLVIPPGVDIDLDAALPLASRLGGLSSLNLSFSKVTDDQLQHVAAIRSLEDLQLVQTGISDVGVKAISDMSNLDSLLLGGTKISSGCLEDIGKLKNLKNLNLDNTALSGGYDPLVGLDQLALLVLGRIKISDADADVLIKIPNLLRLDLTGGEVSDAALKKLRANIKEVAAVPLPQ